ncbi:MAG: type II toxin-antitoxin system death-on-curing family toxin [Planctomycetota bacterium]
MGPVALADPYFVKQPPFWLLEQVVLACHAEALRRHGGADGVRDPALLQSAMARPQQLFHDEQADLCRLAAAYAHGIVRNHPFVDGNKRAGFLAAIVFLLRNGLRLVAHPAHGAVFTIGLAEGSLSEDAYALWLRENTEKVAAKRQRPGNGKSKGRRSRG